MKKFLVAYKKKKKSTKNLTKPYVYISTIQPSMKHLLDIEGSVSFNTTALLCVHLTRERDAQKSLETVSF